MGYAAFFKRCVAFLIDQLIVAAVSFPILMLLAATTSKYARAANSQMFTIFLLVGWLYYAKQESSPLQATFGKKWMGMKVTDGNGDRISFGKATGRYFSHILSGLLYGIGFLMAIWTEQKQALHDKICDTYVVTAETDAEFFKPATPQPTVQEIMDQKLNTLDELLKRGVLTQQEFVESKKKLLATRSPG